jgi:hypothetical protein
VVILLTKVRGITMTDCTVISCACLFLQIATIMIEAQFQPQLTGVTLSIKSSQVRLIGVEYRLRGATVGGEPSSPSEVYLKQAPQVGTPIL